MTETIFALASARGKAGIAVMRISGPDAWPVAARLTPLPAPRHAGLRQLRDDEGEIIDEALVLAFEAEASFTGEPVVELHLHGAMAVVDAVTAWLTRQPEARLADPGEFTRRALSNGRLDLAQVEGLGDLIASETEAQRRQAMRVMRGELSTLSGEWRSKLIRARALLEATIDFADEDVPEQVTPEVSALLLETISGMKAQLDGAMMAERIREGFEIALVGRPNAGKSTLLNLLAGREAAITSAVAGTTRDVIEVRMDLKGLPVTLLDMAGVRQTTDEVEAIGVERARQRALDADLRLFLVAPGDSLGDLEALRAPGDIVLATKSDLLDTEAANAISARTGAGVPQLLDLLAADLSGRYASASTLIRQRHRLALEAAVTGLLTARSHVEAGSDDLAAEEIRAATHAVDLLVGKVDIEHVLDDIFANFCLGK
ncbi:tRNA uridine-5-carboxymethylaminomethyl(34) synthesis GTPase MnmE [Oceanicella sp. SM1341]|uniref:tRNA uridine-5-carboxymethylaminomethyl(34) synthesis GTPase MnmE n=1 Tax=Oceanicella sp. SM1341 TaxID=1548889 RepID=UPI000E538E97|nr:tRNA uridine-5-carboxymethylaminomethyl(34) synthesis GTPase MnmE [Oceanicella sp. SM1341]